MINHADDAQHPTRIIDQSEHGYVAYCLHCQDFQITFRNLLLKLNAEDLPVFTRSLQICLADERYALDTPMGKRCFFRTPYQEITFQFTREELELLIQMMEESQVLIEAWECLVS